MSEHTPTPWAVDPDHRPGMGWNAHVVEAADLDNRVCFMTSGPEGKVNAAFIVKAVNHHDALVGALTELYAQVRGECPSLLNEDSGGDGTLDIEIQTLLAAVGNACMSPSSLSEDGK